jgi:ribosomal protein S12
MCPTLAQLRKGARCKKTRRNKMSAFEGAPLRKGIIYKIAVMSPRKPNSARRTFAKVRLVFNGRRLFAKIPGMVIIFCKHIHWLW